jgi:pimeloyl-ACP methyl ester carboxylesterase
MFGRSTILALLGAICALAQSQSPSGPIRSLVMNKAQYRLRAGESAKIDAPPETLDFVRNAKSRTVTIEGRQTRGFAVGPNMRGDEILLAASLTMKAGEYTVTVSAVGESGEERAAAASITVDALPVVPSGGSTPPVVLLNGWQFSVFPPSSCPISATGSAETFGSLATQLVAPEVYFFDNCVEQSVNGSSIEELGMTLGQFLNMVQYAGGALVPEVDLIGHSMGGLIVRSYLAGLQANDALSPVLNPRVRKFIEIATPNFGSFLAANYSDAFTSGTQAAEMVPGSGLLWTLGTWNQRGDDLRGVDALAIIGNAGYWKSSIFSLTQLNNATDGVVSMTSASLNFARDASRTRILPYCHIDSVAGAFIDCTGKGIADVDEAPETGVIVLSFLANTTAWESEGYSNQTQYGGGYFALENAAGTEYTAFSSVLLGSQSFETGAGTTNTIFYNEFVNVGTGTFTATSTANQATTCGPFAVTGGYYSIFRCKFSPMISSVGPLLPNVAGRVVTSGGTITIGGVGFGQQCSGCRALAYPGPVALQVSSWGDAAIAALLPSTFNGIAEVVVQASGGNWFGEAGDLRRIPTGQVNGFGGNRSIGIGAGEQPFHGALGAPVAAEQFQQPRRQQGLPILASFSEPHPEDVTRGVDVAHFELGGFGDPESRAVEHGQHRAMAETAGRLQQGFDFFPAEDQRQLSFPTGERDTLDGDFLVQCMGIEEPEGTYHLDESGKRHFLLLDQKQLIPADVFGVELIGWFAEVLSEHGNGVQVKSNGCL